MKYKYTFFLINGPQVSIESAQNLELDAEWLTLKTNGDKDEWKLHLRNVTHIYKEPASGK